MLFSNHRRVWMLWIMIVWIVPLLSACALPSQAPASPTTQPASLPTASSQPTHTALPAASPTPPPTATFARRPTNTSAPVVDLHYYWPPAQYQVAFSGSAASEQGC